MYKNTKIIIFGGTGTIGTELVRQLLKEEPKVIRIFSNDENSLFESKGCFGNLPNLRWILGDVRDKDKVDLACVGIDYAFNCAAIKHVDISEYNPIEAIMINVMGLENIILSCFRHTVLKLLQISTDKAVEPTSVMGATKLLAERLCVNRNYPRTSNVTQIGCVRLGNVWGSRGSIVPIVEDWIRKGVTEMKITDLKMKRWFIGIVETGKFILDTMKGMIGREIHIPRNMEHISIKEVIERVIHNYEEVTMKPLGHIKISEMGQRPGEKLEEKLFSENEKITEYKNRYVINNGNNNN